VTRLVGPRVRLVGWTQFEPPEEVPWDTDAEGGPALAEFAGRACYQSWKKPNPETATNDGYLRHIMQVGHFSVIEHAQATFYITGISRACSHELVRHRHFSYSQLSQRYVDESDADWIMPRDILDDRRSSQIYLEVLREAQENYRTIVESLSDRFTHIGNATERRKKARQAARMVLPNAVETKIVVTGNYRAWSHFIDMRATEHADPEIREVAVLVLEELRTLAPAVFDYRTKALDDLTRVAVKNV